ncbi:MAG: S9 family peptidase [Planctomycetes bacterium]|nr:S9 family peptidase [Planctomycetota bacterium]
MASLDSCGTCFFSFLWLKHHQRAVMLCLICILPCIDAAGQEKTAVVEANWEAALKWLPDKNYARIMSTELRPHWLPDSDRFWYGYLTGAGLKYWLVDPVQKSRVPLFDHARLAAELTRLTHDPHDLNNLGLQELTLMEGSEKIRFQLNCHSFEYDLIEEKVVQVETEAPAEPVPWQNRSPDNSIGVFAKGNNLFTLVLTDESAQEKQLTFDGEKGYSWGVDWEVVDDADETKRSIAGEWSPDSQYFALLRADLREVGDLWLVDHLAKPRPALKTYKCPFPGEKVPVWELWIFNRATQKMVPVDVERWPDQRLDDLFENTLWWSGDSKTLYFARRSRDFFKVDVCAADPVSGTALTLLEERLNGQIYIQPPHELPGEGALWWSMRDGWGHYYRYDLQGNLKNQVTQGPFTADKIAGVDEKEGLLFFEALGREKDRNPYYTHLYRVNLDGTGMKLLTPEDAQHACVWSPSKNFFVDNYSRVDLPTRCLLRDRDGRLILDLETADISRLIEAGWQPPRLFKAKSADGITDQWGVMYLPFDFDPAGKYPIATRVYPGRQDEFIPKSFWPVDAETVLAQLGCIVVRFGNRGGTYKRGFAYREYERDDFRDYGLADKKAVITQLAERHDFIDIDRVGIYGGSSGGFMTVSAMLVYPEFFKVGVAMTAPNDPGIYYNQWVERYKGVKQVTTEDGTVTWESEAAGNIELAENLQGRLLMLYGAQDDNVHPAHLFRMADAFIKAGKRFDMFIIPGADHALGDWRYLYSTIWDYFAEHLIGDPRKSVDIIRCPE